MDVHPIRDDEDHARALKQVERLWGADPDTPEGESLEVLVTLVDAYEARHHTIDLPDPIQAIRFRMEQQGLTRADLEPLIGGRGRVSEVLSGKRSLSLRMIRRLHEHLDIPAAVLIQPPDQDEAA